MKQKVFLNLGCGFDIKTDTEEIEWINLDKEDVKGVDKVHDINIFPYPFKDNYFDGIYCSHILEHANDFFKTMDELHRIAKPNAKIMVRVPHFSSAQAFCELHKTFFRWRSFGEINDPLYGFELSKLHKFRVLKKKIVFMKSPLLFYNYLIEPIMNFWKFPLLYENTFLRNLFPAFEIYFELEVYTPTHCQDRNLGFLKWTHHHMLEQLEQREPGGRTGVPTATPYTSAGVR